MKDNTMNSVNISNLTAIEIISLATEDAMRFIDIAKINKHVSVGIQTGISYINLNGEYNIPSFVVNKNPFSIYVEKFSDQDMKKVKPVDYTFPSNCVNESVLQYMDTFITVLNNKLDFSKIEGDVEFKDKMTKEVGKYREIRPMFNIPENSKSINPSPTGSLRIDIDSKKDKKTYQLIISQSNKRYDNISSIEELSNIIQKYNSYQVFIKPTKLVSSYMYYGPKYKLLWQVCYMKEIVNRIDEMDFLCKLLDKEYIHDSKEKDEEEALYTN